MTNDSLDAHSWCLLHTQVDRWLRLQISQSLNPTGLTMMEWLLLMSVKKYRRDGLTVTEMAELLGVSLPQVTALTQQLLKKDYIKQRVGSEDRRSRRLFITPQGDAIGTTGQRLIKEVIEDATEAPLLLSYKRSLAMLVEQPTVVLE